MNGRSLTTLVMDFAAAVVTLLVFAWLLAASGKGFDLTDEGFYLLTARHPEDVVMMSTSFHHVTSWLLWATGGSIAAIRIIGVAGTAASGVALGYAALAVSGGGRSLLVVSTVTVYALIAYVWLLLTPSYNTYNGWAVAGMTVCVLRGFASFGAAPARLVLSMSEDPPGDRLGAASDASRRRTRLRTWMFGSGLFLGLSLFMKFPTAAVMGALVTFAIAAWPGLSRRDRTSALCWIAVGAATTAAVMFVIVVSPLHWWRETVGGVEQVARLDAGHGPSAIGRYARELWGHLGTGTRPVIWLLWALGFASAAVLAAASDTDARLRRAARVTIWLVLMTAAVRSACETAAWLFPPLLSGYAMRDMFPFWIARVHLHWGLLMIAIAAGAGLGTRWRGASPANPADADANRKRVIVGLLLAGGTGAAAFGTANPIYLNLMLALGSWAALLVLAVRYASARLGWSVAGDAVLLFLVALAAVQIVGGTVTASYGLHEGVRRQTVATSIGSPPSRLSLDPETHRLITALRRLTSACGFKEGDDLFAFYNMPGLVYALGGRSPGLPWYTYGLRGSRVVNEMGLEKAGAARVSRAFILQTPDADPWLRTLAPLGIDFPARYTDCGTVTRRLRGLTFELTLWRPASLPQR